MGASRDRGPGLEARPGPRRAVAITFTACFVLGLLGSLGVTVLLRARGGMEPSGSATSTGIGSGPRPQTPGPAVLREVDALLRQGAQARDRERFADAFRDFSRAIDLAPRDPRAYHGLAEVYKLLDRSELAEAPLRRAIEVDPDYTPARLFLARILRDIGGHEEAVRILEAARRTGGENPAILWELAQHEVRLGRAVEAVPWLEKCRAAWPEYAYGVAYLGKARAEAGDLAGAERDYEAALRLDPRLTLGWLWLGQLLVATGRQTEAEKALANHQRLNRLEGEARGCERDLLRRPNNLPVLVHLAEIRVALGRYRDALTPLERAIELDPGNLDLAHLRTQIEERLASAGGGSAASGAAKGAAAGDAESGAGR